MTGFLDLETDFLVLKKFLDFLDLKIFLCRPFIRDSYIFFPSC